MMVPASFENRIGLFFKGSVITEMKVLLFRRLEWDRGTTNIGTVTKRTMPKHSMMEHTHMSATSRDRFMKAAEKEMAKFERREMEFRKVDRKERAAELRIPLSNGDHS